MVTMTITTHVPPNRLSVLALSSRFDGPALLSFLRVKFGLSVLALSSRFDGLFSVF